MASPVLPALLLAASLAGPAVGASLPDSSTTTQVYMQRAADGSIVLTDRPSAKAVTERTWTVEREDRNAAQQRALEVRREADTVADRIQRSIEAQQRRASESDLMRLQVARLDRAPDTSSDANDDGVAIIAPFGLRSFANRRHVGPGLHRPPHRRPLPVMPMRPF